MTGIFILYCTHCPVGHPTA